MKMLHSTPPTLLVAVLLVLAFTGCSRESKKARYLEQADRAYASGNYDPAEIDYKNILQIENLNAHAIGRLGLIYADQGRIAQSIPLVMKGRELQPDNLELRLKFAQLSLATGNLKEARAEANALLDRQPTHQEAPLLLVATLTKPEDIAEIRTRLESLPASALNGAPVQTALAMIELRQGHPKECEALLQKALAADPKFATAHSANGSLYALQNEKTKAQQSFKLAADASPSRSPRRIQYAQFLIKTGDIATGKKYLEEMTRTTPDFIAPWTLLAEVALLEKRFADCAAAIGKTIARDPQNLEALFLRGRMHLTQGNTAKGIEEFERLQKIYPRAPQIQYQLGIAYLAANNASQATVALKQTLVLAPGHLEATVALANLYLKTGDPGATISLLKPIIQQHPKIAQIRFLLAEAYRAQNNFAESLAIYRQQEKDFPGNAQTSLMTGLVLLQLNQPTEARAAFTEALARSPGLVPALERLATLDLADNKLDAAALRVEAELVRNPNSAGTHVLMAKIHLAQKDTDRAQAEFQKAIELQPEGNEAYFLLAQLYLTSNQEQKALANLQSIVGRNPKDVSAWMLIASICMQQKDYPAARDAYEKILAVNPKSSIALNNIAGLYSDQFNEPEKALAAAQKARELLPQEPHVADTLGWILFKKGQYRWALSLLEESVEKLSDSAEIQYHLGMARYMLGQSEPARLALQRALDLNQPFAASADAKKRLTLVTLDPGTADAAARALVEKMVAEQPGDPIALARLAALQERDGALDKAIATHLKAAQANSSASAPLLSLARLYARGKDTTKALEMAKAARKISPDDPATTRILGQIAFQAGDFDWSASLLHEASQKITDDPELFFDEAEASYSIGRVADAEANLRSALTLGQTKPFARTDKARQFLDMIELARNPTSSALDRVAQILSQTNDDVPALIAQGAIHEQSANPAAALTAYEKALARFPAFTPAKVRLAILASAKPEFDAKAYAWAQQARTALPNDPEIAKALGILLYRKGGEAARAITLLKQSSVTRTNDAELLYYLGMAQLQAKDLTAARQTLQKSLDAGLSPALAAEARKALPSLN